MSELKYKHYLLTRFNIKFTAGLPKQLQKIDVSTDEEYLTERFRLFLKYTVPSVKSQTVKNFEWLVFFSDCTLYKFKKIIYGIEKEMPFFKPVFVAYGEDFCGLINDYIRKTPVDFYITSRVDNDDALSSDYIEKVQNYFIDNKITESRVLDYCSGYQLDEKKGYLFKFRYKCSHFSSLSLPFNGQNIDNILSYRHSEIDKYFKTDLIFSEKPMWLEVVHGLNVYNWINIKEKNIVGKGYENVLSAFGLDIKIRTKNIKIYVISSNLKRSYGKLKHNVKMIIKKIIKRK